MAMCNKGVEPAGRPECGIHCADLQGIVSGYGDGTFGPNDPITREQLAVMLWRYSGSPAADSTELDFNDESEING